MERKKRLCWIIINDAYCIFTTHVHVFAPFGTAFLFLGLFVRLSVRLSVYLSVYDLHVCYGVWYNACVLRWVDA